MDNINYSSFQNMCRTCMLTSDLIFIHDNIIDVLQFLTDSKYSKSDELPQQLCIKCLQTMNEIQSFALKCQQTQLSLTKCLTEFKSIQNALLTNTDKTNENVNKIEFIEIKEEVIDDINNEELITEHFVKDEFLFQQMVAKQENEEHTIQDTRADQNYFGTISKPHEDNQQSQFEYNDFQICSAKMDHDNSNDSSTSPSVETVLVNSLNLLPNKSKKRYELSYNQFMKWRKAKNISSFSEKVLMTYFEELATKGKPSSVSSHYSMLRTTISVHHDVNIACYLKLKAFLKQNSDGYQPKKSKTFTLLEMYKFLHEAPDSIYLFEKVALIFGINCACRRAELCQLKIDDITDLGSSILVNINDIRTKKLRSFTIAGDFYTIYKKYATLRPSNASNRRFFLNYRNQKCTNQPIGINKFGSTSQKIAKYLDLKNPELYTGHCFRRSSATILIEAGEDITTL